MQRSLYILFSLVLNFPLAKLVILYNNHPNEDSMSDYLLRHDEGEVHYLSLNRAQKRNAMNDGLISALDNAFDTIPETAKVVVISGEGDHFSAGLDLSELTVRDVVQSIHHSRNWHRVFEKIQYGRVPVVAALHGAVIGGGLELAASCHIRVADESAYYALPEGQRGIFVGGGGSMRLPRLVGVSIMTDMMMTGRVYTAAEGITHKFSQYLTPKGEALAKAKSLALKIAGNAGMTNYALIHVLPRIAESDPAAGLMMESLVASIASSSPEAQTRLQAFLDKKAAKIVKE
jgi:(methylthio)acryloyl-CoA hydratase